MSLMSPPPKKAFLRRSVFPQKKAFEDADMVIVSFCGGDTSAIFSVSAVFFGFCRNRLSLLKSDVCAVLLTMDPCPRTNGICVGDLFPLACGQFNFLGKRRPAREEVDA
jgi:hypothetical protein